MFKLRTKKELSNLTYEARAAEIKKVKKIIKNLYFVGGFLTVAFWIQLILIFSF